MKIKGKGECMYRSFKGYNVTMRVINNETEEISSVVYVLEGTFLGEQDIKNSAKVAYEIENENMTVIKINGYNEFSKRIAMTISDFVKYGFEIDEDNKPID